MRTIFISIVLTSSLTSFARAERRPEFGVTIGGHAFSDDVELGVADHMSEPGPASSGLIGLRVALPLARRVAAETEALWIPTEDDVLGTAASVYALRAHARFDVLTGRLRPFIVAGVGAHVLRSSSSQMANDADRALHYGFGARFAISETLDARIDLRHLFVPDRTLDGATEDFELMAGMTYRFGKPRAPRRELRAVPRPRPGDRDGDGFTDDRDACAAQPEDADHFEDHDGCPDLDDDNDGIVDRVDACPLDPEIRNGWKDEDGCSDQMIQELAGIGFDHGSATIDRASAPLLARALQILREHPNITIQISGHTSAEGGRDRNLALSRERAEAVKSYLVNGGIAESRIMTVGHGAAIPIADNATEEGRRKNRRIEFRILVFGERP